ncbi:hypothetical protein FQZ97_1126820 [compost metagenome]
MPPSGDSALLFQVAVSVSGCVLPSSSSWPAISKRRSARRLAPLAVNTMRGNSPELRKSGPLRCSSRLRWLVKTLAVSTSMRTSDSVPLASSKR